MDRPPGATTATDGHRHRCRASFPLHASSLLAGRASTAEAAPGASLGPPTTGVEFPPGIGMLIPSFLSISRTCWNRSYEGRVAIWTAAPPGAAQSCASFRLWLALLRQPDDTGHAH